MTTRRLLLCSVLAVSTLTACSRSPEPRDSGALEPRESLDLDVLDRAGLTALGLVHARAGDVDPEQRAAIVERLRAGGPAGLDALIAEYRAAAQLSAAEDQAWRALIDDVAGQRDAVYGGMFWQTDMQVALAQAEASGKPVLSLRLLGDLRSEYSCANSRLFRTLLYADPELATWLEANFVLHWSSERPVPRVEIDFGDGRVVERTITGNSAHFVLDHRGRTIDVIPGLWSAPALHTALERSLDLHTELAKLTSERRWRATLADHHEAALEAAADRLALELTRIRDGAPQDREAIAAWLAGTPGDGRPVPAVAAVPMAIGKMKMEAPILAAAPSQLGGKRAGVERARTEIGPRDDELLELGARVAGSVELHHNTLAIIASEHAVEALVAADQRERVTDALVETLRVSVREDTAKNALELHPRIHAELAARARDDRSLGFADVDEWVYARLFETPAADPWLGLVDPTIYTGLERAGLVEGPG